MKVPFLFRADSRSSSSSSSSWPWPTYFCHQPRTLSFRIGDSTMFKTLNSAYCIDASADTPEPFFTTNSTSDVSPAPSDEKSGGAHQEPSIETVIKGLRSERLFFEPEETSSILEKANNNSSSNNNNKVSVKEAPFKQSIVLSLDSQDPHLDFKKSMEEMVEAHGLKDWDALEELLSCYLEVNGKSNHGYIVTAFADLLAGLPFASSSSSSSSTSSREDVISESCNSCSCSCSFSAPSPSSPLSFSTSSNYSSSSATNISDVNYPSSAISPSCVVISSSLEDARHHQEEIDISPSCLSSLEEEVENEIIKDN